MEITREVPKSKVYIKIDEKNRIIACDGGYTMSNFENVNEWIFIDEGYGDKYNLCQTHYFEDGLYTEEMVCRYKYENGVATLRSKEEIDADTPEPTPEPEPIPEDDSDVWEEMAQAINKGVNEV